MCRLKSFFSKVVDFSKESKLQKNQLGTLVKNDTYISIEMALGGITGIVNLFSVCRCQVQNHETKNIGPFYEYHTWTFHIRFICYKRIFILSSSALYVMEK